MMFEINVGDRVAYGKYKNKFGVIKGFGMDAKGNPTMMIEPTPKGRKQAKIDSVFKVRFMKYMQSFSARKQKEEEEATKGVNKGDRAPVTPENSTETGDKEATVASLKAGHGSPPKQRSKTAAQTSDTVGRNIVMQLLPGLDNLSYRLSTADKPAYDLLKQIRDTLENNFGKLPPGTDTAIITLQNGARNAKKWSIDILRSGVQSAAHSMGVKLPMNQFIASARYHGEHDKQEDDLITRTVRQIIEKYSYLVHAQQDVKVKNPGILEIPEGKTFVSTPVGHFVELAQEKGPGPIQKAVSNLIRWFGPGSAHPNAAIVKHAEQVREAIKTKVTQKKEAAVELTADANRPSGSGWEKIPGSEHGGMRRRSKDRHWQYWYPSVDSARAAAKHHAKEASNHKGNTVFERAQHQHAEDSAHIFIHDSNEPTPKGHHKITRRVTDRKHADEAISQEVKTAHKAGNYAVHNSAGNKRGRPEKGSTDFTVTHLPTGLSLGSYTKDTAVDLANHLHKHLPHAMKDAKWGDSEGASKHPDYDKLGMHFRMFRLEHGKR